MRNATTPDFAKAGQQHDAPTKGSGRLKTTLFAAGILLAEAALIAGGFMYLGGPSEVAAQANFISDIEPQRISEVSLINEKLTNDRMGSVYVYPVEIYVHVDQADARWFGDLVGQYQNEIRAEMTALWRGADPESLQDPHMEIMTRRIEHQLRERFEGEADPEFPRIIKAVIVSGAGFRIRG